MARSASSSSSRHSRQASASSASGPPPTLSSGTASSTREAGSKARAKALGDQRLESGDEAFDLSAGPSPGADDGPDPAAPEEEEAASSPAAEGGGPSMTSRLLSLPGDLLSRLLGGDGGDGPSDDSGAESGRGGPSGVASITGDALLDELLGAAFPDGDGPDWAGLEFGEIDRLSVPASPGLSALLDDALYRAYRPELVPTVSAASQLLSELISMREAAALVLRECRWCAGTPMGGGVAVVRPDDDDEGEREVACGRSFGGGAVVDEDGNPLRPTEREDSGRVRWGPASSSSESASNEEVARWNEFDVIHDFARQCYHGAREAIQRLTTDRLAESANVPLCDSLAAAAARESGGGGGAPPSSSGVPSADGGAGASLPGVSPRASSPAPSPGAPPPGPALYDADLGIGRLYDPDPRRDRWEDPRLRCPDHPWADDAAGACARMLRALSRHRLATTPAAAHGWDRLVAAAGDGGDGATDHDDDDDEDVRVARAPTHASRDPHPFPSLEAIHALRYLLSEVLPRDVPSALNRFRAAAEANAVVTKRLYLVKCEYRAPLRALWESRANLTAAPKASLVERYLRDYHSVDSSGADGGGKAFRRKGSIEATKKTAIQQQRDKLEKVITESYWKDPTLVEALQLERCCERMEVEMSQMLLPLSNLAHEIMTGWKGRLRSVSVVRRPTGGRDEEDADEDEETSDEDDSDGDENDEEGGRDSVQVLLGWREVPYMRELLMRLKSILRRKPDLDESIGIRPLLLDLQGVSRHKQDAIDSSLELPFYPPPPGSSKPSRFDWRGWLGIKKPAVEDPATSPIARDEWFYLELFLTEVERLLELLALPNTPFLVEDSKSDRSYLLDLIEQCTETWDGETFRAQYQDWFDMVKRQQLLNAGGALTALSGEIRDAEIELSIAMASRDQLERVRKRLEALRADQEARHRVLRHFVFDLGCRELNDFIVVEAPAKDATVEFPLLSDPGVFGHQLALSE